MPTRIIYSSVRVVKSVCSFVFLLLISGCDLDCPDCFTPPEPFLFELVEASSGENLFANKKLDPAGIEVVNIETGAIIEHTFIDENEVNLLQIHSIGWKTEIVEYSISVSEKHIFNLYVHAERKSENCCSFTTFKDIRLDREYYQVEETGVYQVFVAE